MFYRLAEYMPEITEVVVVVTFFSLRVLKLTC